MSNNKVIVYGNRSYNKAFKHTTHRVTAIYIDSHGEIATFIIQKGNVVERVDLTMENCQDLGIINIEKLERYCK